MRISHLKLTFILCSIAGFTCLQAAERIPVENFTTDPLYTGLTISPDGKSIAFLREFSDIAYLCFSDIDDNSDEINRLKIGKANAFNTMVSRDVGHYWWINNERVLIATEVWDRFYGGIAVDKNGTRWKGLTGYEKSKDFHTLVAAIEVKYIPDDGGEEILMLNRRDADGKDRKFPHVIRLDTFTGSIHTIVENPGDISYWIFDNKGDVRLGVNSEASNKLIFRETVDAPWTPIEIPGRGHEKLKVLGFGKDSNLYVKGFNEEDRWSLFQIDLENIAVSEPLLSDPVYDVVPDGLNPGYAETPTVGMIMSKKDQKLLGMRYVAETPKVKWFDPEYEKIQSNIDKLLPNTINLFIDASNDESRLVFLSMSDRQPGVYHLLDRNEKSVKNLGSRMPWLRPANLSPMLAIQYQSRDGMTIHGYLTVPVGHQPKNLPLVVMPHGGPWVRDFWKFDPMIQLLASRGYAVLQMNYRGSNGYGSAFRMAGTKEIGGKIQDDIEDATLWAVAAGVADPKRIAIAGMSYGGYSALFAAGKQPDLYQCAISMSGVSDWPKMFDKDSRRPEYRRAAKKWTKEIGDPELDEEQLKARSPYYFAKDIKMPVLIIHGKQDSTVPMSQAKQMAKQLKKFGNKPETLYLGWEAHGLHKQRSREEAYQKIIDFLEDNIGPGVEYLGK